jgi:phosphoribosyl 1,2-cyclic phosphate phosphodiesterase
VDTIATSTAMLRFTILGCGASQGTPRIDGDWGACDPSEPKNRRLRSSLLVDRVDGAGGVTRVLIDTGPDLRQQALGAGIDWVDAVAFTHGHADHIHGLDDLRGFVINRGRRIDSYADAKTAKRLAEAFGYCYQTPAGSSYPPILNDHRITAATPFEVTGEGGTVALLPLRQLHGQIGSLGFRIGGLAYSSDISVLPDETLPHLRDLDVWIVDALRYTPHPSHLSVSQACELAGRVGARLTVLTHMHIDLDYQKLKRELPANIVPAYDGMIFELHEVTASIVKA